jgi:hypothetical protein
MILPPIGLIPKLLFGLMLLAFGATFAYMFYMPERSYAGTEQPLTDVGLQLSSRLNRHVSFLSNNIGNRSMANYDNLIRAQAYIQRQWGTAGLNVQRQDFTVGERLVANVFVEFPGKVYRDRIIVVGAHYDSDGEECPGANDNGTGVAALMELALRFVEVDPAYTVRFIAFVNEELPYFGTSSHGAVVAAKTSRQKNESLVGMLSLETIGYYTDAPKTQRYPAGLKLIYPDQGNFLAFVGDMKSGLFLRRALSIFRKHAAFPSEGLASPRWIPRVGASDHAAYWAEGYPAIMITDTANFRYPHYHLPSDTSDKIDYHKLATVTLGIEEVVRGLAKAN